MVDVSGLSSLVGDVTSVVSGATSLVSAVSNLLGLRNASWNGVPFAMEAGVVQVGRRLAEHDYPYRDSVWLEDQGKLPRRFEVRGFLVSNSLIYGGGDVQSQINALMAAAEKQGLGTLVHPTRGTLSVNLTGLTITENWDAQGSAMLQFSFVLGGAQAFPTILASASGLLGSAAGLLDAAGLSGFASAVIAPLQQGISAVSSIATTANQWCSQLTTLGSDATSLFNTVSQLGGADFGRYFNGANAGFLQGLQSPYAGAASVEDLIADGVQQQAAIVTASAAVSAAIGTLNVTTTTSDVATAAQASVAALQASAANPADAIRLLTSLAAYSPTGLPASTAAGVAVSALFRRAAISAAARAVAQYQPSSSNDAVAVRAQVLQPLNAEILIAGDTGANDVFTALRGLRASVVQALAQSGAGLPSLVTIASQMPLPALVLAYQRYGDAGRAAELVGEADPVNPLFMPLSFQALSS